MPFYFRKSVSAGPFRFNFSNGGVGVSVGVRGLRIGTGPRGHYIHAGRNGFYYRASLGRASARPQPRLQPETPAPPTDPPSPGVDLIEIESANVLALQDVTFADLLKELNEKARQARLSVVVPALLGMAGFGAALAINPQGLWLVALALPGWLLGRWLDSYKRTSVLFYDIDGEQQGRYSRLTDAFDDLMACGGKWHIQAQGMINDLMTRKRNAGATGLVNRKTTGLGYRLPEIVKSNITPPSLQAGRQTLFFFPDVVLVADGNRFGAISYPDLRVDHQQSRFIEDGRQPSDAQVVDHTWQFTNKSGGPDRRFNNNRQLPICLYDSLHLSSPTGLNELFQFSRTGVTGRLATAVDDMRAPSSAATARSPQSAVPRSRWESEGSTPAETPPPQRRRYAGKVAIGLILAVIAYAVVVTPREPRQAAAPPPPPVAATIAPPAEAATPPATAAKSDSKPPTASTPGPSKAEPPAPAPKDDRPLSADEVRELQERLKALGFDPGFIDGIPGPQTAGAIRRFESSASLPAQGNIDRATLQRVRDARPAR